MTKPIIAKNLHWNRFRFCVQIGNDILKIIIIIIEKKTTLYLALNIKRNEM